MPNIIKSKQAFLLILLIYLKGPYAQHQTPKGITIKTEFNLFLDENLIEPQKLKFQKLKNFFKTFYNALTQNNCFVRGLHKYDVYLHDKHKAHLN